MAQHEIGDIIAAVRNNPELYDQAILKLADDHGLTTPQANKLFSDAGVQLPQHVLEDIRRSELRDQGDRGRATRGLAPGEDVTQAPLTPQVVTDDLDDEITPRVVEPPIELPFQAFPDQTVPLAPQVTDQPPFAPTFAEAYPGRETTEERFPDIGRTLAFRNRVSTQFPTISPNFKRYAEGQQANVEDRFLYNQIFNPNVSEDFEEFIRTREAGTPITELDIDRLGTALAPGADLSDFNPRQKGFLDQFRGDVRLQRRFITKPVLRNINPAGRKSTERVLNREFASYLYRTRDDPSAGAFAYRGLGR